MRSIVSVLLLSCLIGTASAQKGHAHIDPNTRGWEVIGVDHVVKDAKGIRTPMHAVRGMSYVAVYSKDGQHCLVSYRAATYQAHNDFRDHVKNGNDPKLQVFDRALVKREVWEAALKTGEFADVDFDKLHAK